jgi:hypothetical protein
MFVSSEPLWVKFHCHCFALIGEGGNRDFGCMAMREELEVQGEDILVFHFCLLFNA